jgi:hypothetical protein
VKEKQRETASGFAYLVLMILVFVGAIWGIIWSAQTSEQSGNPTRPLLFALVLVIDIVCLKGLFGVQPNQGAVLQLFGHYVGTERTPGLRWANPFYAKKFISLRTRNFETAQLKVNDHDGNPIEFAAVVVWNVVDTAEACFSVDNYENYVKVQSEAALRNLATSYPYDAHEEGVKSLRGNTAEVAAHLRDEIQERLTVAGVQVKEARISHLAYAVRSPRPCCSGSRHPLSSQRARGSSKAQWAWWKWRLWRACGAAGAEYRHDVSLKQQARERIFHYASMPKSSTRCARGPATTSAV